MICYHARWICPVSSPPFSDGTVAVENGRIVYVGTRIDAPREGSDVDLGDVIVMPGLVNAHCQLELSVMRGFLDGLGFREWIIRLTSARRAVLTQAMLLDAARLGVAEGLQHGITTFADTGDSGAGFDAMLELGARGISYREVFGPDPARCDEAIAGLAVKLDDMLQRATDRGPRRRVAACAIHGVRCALSGDGDTRAGATTATRGAHRRRCTRERTGRARRR